MDTTTLISGLAPPVDRHAHHSDISRFSAFLSARRLLNALVIGAADAITLGLALAIIVVLRYTFIEAPAVPARIWAFIPIWWLGAGLAHLLPGWGLSSVEHFRRQIVILSLLFGSMASLAVLQSRLDTETALSLTGAWLLAIVLVPLGRMLVRHALCQRSLFGMPTVIFARADVAAELVERLRSEQGLGYFPIGVCTNEAVSHVAGVPVVGRMNQTAPAASAAIVACRGMSPLEHDATTTRVLRAYQNVLILPDVPNVPSLFALSRDLGGAVGLEISQALLSPIALRLKRGAEMALVVATAPLWLGLYALIYSAIWLAERERPIFRQERAGHRGRTFFAIKFRTMVLDAENVLKRHLAADPALRAEWETNFKLKKDPRITTIGHFLRRSSLDELPQLFNVFKGEMALVGPRPLPVYHLGSLPESVQEIRHEVRPGLTGLWQVSGRSDAGNAGMARWDPYYVRNWSLWLDIVILVRTVRVVLRGSGAR